MAALRQVFTTQVSQGVTRHSIDVSHDDLDNTTSQFRAQMYSRDA
jgi:hypothetical protein